MEAQQELNDILNFEQLDLILSILPDPAGAKVLRDQFVSACRIVKAKEDEAEALHRSAQSQSNLLEAQLKELETERKAFQEQKNLEIEKLKAEQANLESLAQSLGEKFRDLTERIGEVSGNVNNCQTTVGEKLEGFEGVISARASDREENVNQSLKELLDSVQKNTDDVSTMKDKSDEMATAMNSVKEHHERIETSLRAGVTKESIKDQIGPLVDLTNTIKGLVEGLPTRESIDTRLAQVGGLAEQLRRAQVNVNELVQENQGLRNQNETLTTERNCAQNLSEQAKAALEEFDKDVRKKDSKIEGLQKANGNLQERLMEANQEISQGREARRQLKDAQPVLQTAEARRLELAEIKLSLQQVQQTVNETERQVESLKSQLEREKTVHDRCSVDLTQALTDRRDVNRQKEKLEGDISQVRKELKELRSQQTLDLQKQLKDQWAAVSEAMKEQLSEKKSHEETVSQLSRSWSSEKEALQGEISAKVSLIENLEQKVKTLQSRVSTLEPLRIELQTANDNLRQVNLTLEATEGNLRNSQGRVAELEKTAIVSANELEAVKAENGCLQKSSESASQKLDTCRGTIERLEQERDTVNEALSSLQAQSVVIPEGVTGEISRIYYRAADQLRNIPIVLDRNGEPDSQQLASELITVIDGYKWKENLLRFLHSRPEGWFCLQQVTAGDRDLVANGGECQHHDDCLSVKVVLLNGSPTLKFIFSD
ncbi:hypothetical protein FNYG_07135 [Fusarium nygamai]|uniref:Uncharacterized protein n=1 Tax=Gibberella nygamai TaxID=42673 RepID=A0A2K0WB52_GIBNY|nr:hypothetical protein FNYG_07135 [Fusarium nygamai]